MSQRTEEFAEILNKKIVMNPDVPRDYVRKLSLYFKKNRIKGFKYWKLIKQINPKSNYPMTISDFIILYRHTDNLLLEALTYIVRECDSHLDVINIENCNNTNGSFRDEQDDLAIIIGQLTEHLNKSLADGFFDLDERNTAQDKVIELRGVVDRFFNEILKYENH